MTFRLFNHQMHVQVRPGYFSDGLDDRRSDGEVGHEVAIHDVQVEHGGAPALHARDLLSQARKVRR